MTRVTSLMTILYHVQLHGGTTFRNNFSNIQGKQLWPTCQVVSGESCCNIHIGGITYTSHEVYHECYLNHSRWSPASFTIDEEKKMGRYRGDFGIRDSRCAN